MRKFRWFAYGLAVPLSVTFGGCRDNYAGSEGDPTDALAHAERVYVSRKDDGVGHTIGMISATNPPGLLASLRQASHTRTAEPARAPDFLLYAYPPNTVQMTVLYYDSGSGVVGNGNRWLRAPSSFREWIKRASAAVPARHYRVKTVMGTRRFTQVYPHEAPLGTVRSTPGRYHYFSVKSLRAGALASAVSPFSPILGTPGNLGRIGYEAEYTASKEQVGSGLAAKRFTVGPDHLYKQWPHSYVGSTIYYRFRWRYEDGTYSPWSYKISAKVAP